MQTARRVIAGMKALLLAFSLLLAGCASFDGHNLVPGRSTEQDAIETMGKPALELPQPGGKALYFSRLPFGRAIFKASFGADGVLRGVEPTLVPANIARIQVGKTTKEEARAILGPPYRVTREPLKPMDTWEYPWLNADDRRILWISFSDDGVARNKFEGHDFESDPPSGPDMGSGGKGS
jgi:hypothetical protein